MKAFFAMVFAIMRKELRSVARDRTILIAVILQLFIASFSSALLVGMLSLYDPDSMGIYGSLNLSVGMVGTQVEPLAQYLKDRGVTTILYPDLTTARTAFYERQISAILLIPENDTSQAGGTKSLKMYLPQSETTSSLILMVLQEPLKRYENMIREQQGIHLRYTDLQGSPPTTFEFIYSIILPVLMFFPAFVAGSMVVDSLSEEVENNTLETLLSAPLSINRIATGKIAAALLLAAVQSAAWIVLLELNHIVVNHTILVLLLSTIVAGITTVCGAFIAVTFHDRERSQFVYSLFLLLAASTSYLVDLSPIQKISRLAIGDYYTSAWDVLIFAALLAVLFYAFLRSSKFLSQQQAI